MIKFFNIKKNFFSYFILIYFLIGSYLSLQVGITHDESHSNFVWELNKNKLANFFLNKNYDISDLDTAHGYYGIGFYLLSTPLEFIFLKIFNFNEINIDGKNLLIKHPSVFIFFIIGGIYLKKIIFFSTKSNFFSNLAAISFLTYPYLLGHSFFNIKDIPFMSIWIVCTYFLIKILNEYFINSKIKLKTLIFFALFTSYLLSLRISGILIFIEYLIFLIFFINIFNIKLFNFIKKAFSDLLIFILIFSISLYIFYPSFWSDPLKFLDAIKFMSQHVQTVCTITLGECMKAQNLPSSYLFIWLFFKLPIFILIGLSLFPLLEKKIFDQKQNKLILAPLIVSVFTIIFLLIFFEVHLYDELRQVIFLIPLIFIISLLIIFNLKKNIGIYIISLSVIFFIFQNIKIFPYNYIWLNNFTNFINISKNFELDYWGVSTKKIANFLNSEKLDEATCVISNRNNGIEYFMRNQENCFKNFKNLHKKNKRPFYVALSERSINKGIPNNCNLVFEDQLKINFSKENLVLAKVFKCT